MIIVGCDFHPAWQQVAWVDTETGETSERKLSREVWRVYHQDQERLQCNR